jgi:hypothetical protein
VTSTIDGDRRLDVNEFAVFGGYNAIVANKSTQRLSGNENTWVPADTTGPVLIRLGDGQVRIRRGRQNRLVLPRLDGTGHNPRSLSSEYWPTTSRRSCRV